MEVRLGAYCKAQRRRVGWSMLAIAVEAGVKESVIVSFEKGRGWRRRTNEIVAVYARMLDCPPEEVWRDAAGYTDAG